MKKLATTLAATALLCAPATAQVTVPGQPMVPLGYCQVPSGTLASAVKLSTACAIPAGATMAYIQAESANVRYRDDGAAPTTSVGMLIITGLGGGILYSGTLSNLQFIGASGSPLLDISFYRSSSISPTQNDVQAALRAFLLAVLPGPPVVIAGQQNRAAEPQQGDFVVMTPMAFERLRTNVDLPADVRFQGSIAGAVLTVSEVFFGAVTPGATLFGSGVAAGTTVGAASGSGTFAVSPAQSAASQVMSAGAKSVTQGAKVTVQLDFHSQNVTDAGDMAQTVSTLLRDEFGVVFFAALPPPQNGVVPLYADDPKQTPFLNAEQQYEWRWTIEACLQVEQTATVPSQYADSAEVDVVSVEADFPA